MKKEIVRYAREAVAAIFWLYLILKLFVFDVDIFLFERGMPRLTWLLQYKLLVLMVALALAWLGLGHRAFFGFFGFVAAYPVFLLARFVKLIIPRWPLLLLFSPVLYSGIQKARSTFVLYTAAMVSALIIAVTVVKALLVMAMLILAIFIAIHLLRSLRKAYSIRVFSPLTKFVREFRMTVEDGRLGAVLAQSKSAELSGSDPTDKGLAQLYAFHAFSDLVANKVHDLVKRRVFDFYLVGSWVYSVALTSFVYGFEYWALHRIDPASFTGSTGAGFWDFLGLSIGIITTNGISSIEPATSTATLVAYSEAGCNLLIFVILVFSILTAAREAFREDALEFTSELRLTAVAIEQRVLGAYHLTLAQLEVLLSKENAGLINMLRRARGLPEISTAPKTARDLKS